MLDAAIYLFAITQLHAEGGVFSKAEIAVFDRIASAMESGQPSTESVSRTFELPTKCDPSCDFVGSIGTVHYSEGSLRPRKDGLILVLGRFDRDCIRIKEVARRFPKGVIEDACSHGPCWYYTKRYDWGVVSFGMDDIDATCASSLVINTMPNQRLKATN